MQNLAHQKFPRSERRLASSNEGQLGMVGSSWLCFVIPLVDSICLLRKCVQQATHNSCSYQFSSTSPWVGLQVYISGINFHFSFLVLKLYDYCHNFCYNFQYIYIYIYVLLSLTDNILPQVDSRGSSLQHISSDCKYNLLSVQNIDAGKSPKT